MAEGESAVPAMPLRGWQCLLVAWLGTGLLWAVQASVRAAAPGRYPLATIEGIISNVRRSATGYVTVGLVGERRRVRLSPALGRIDGLEPWRSFSAQGVERRWTPADQPTAVRVSVVPMCAETVHVGEPVTLTPVSKADTMPPKQRAYMLAAVRVVDVRFSSQDGHVTSVACEISDEGGRAMAYMSQPDDDDLALLRKGGALRIRAVMKKTRLKIESVGPP